MNTRYSILFTALCALPASAQLVGFYNVGGSTPHYADLGEAFADLMAEGANGDITFLMHPGTYTGQASLGVIPGNPGVITVRSSMNDASTVTLEYDAAFPLPNYIVELEGTPNVKFEDLTFHALNADRARCIHFTGNTDNLKLWDCVFIGSQNTSTNNYFDRVLVQCDQNTLNVPDNPDYLQVIGCEFRYGYQGIELDAEGNSGARALGVMIAENAFTDQLSLGIAVNACTGEISQNRITTGSGNSYTGIRTGYFDNGSKVQRNVIQAHATVSGCTGIEVGNTQNTTGNQVSNNMVTVSASSGEVWGIGVYNLWDMSIAYNTVAVLDGYVSSSAFFHLSNFADAQDCVIRNNIFANYVGGPAMLTTVPGNIATEDHNCLWSEGGALVNSGGTEYFTQAAYQNATGDGFQDIVYDPAFPALPDLHVNSCVLGEHGEYFYVATGDIDYEARGNPVCDVGADEFAYTYDYNVPVISIPDTELPYTLSAPDGSGYTWSQASNTQSIDVAVGGPYSCLFADVNGCTYTIHWTIDVDFTTGVAASEANAFSLFPNPALDAITITGVQGQFGYSIMDASGREALAGTAHASGTLGVATLPAGLYTIRLLLNDAVAPRRFLKR